MKTIYKVLIAFAIMFTFFVAANGQEVKLKATVKTYPTEQAAIDNQTTTLWTVIKDKKVPLYKGPRGGYYIVVKNKEGLWIHRSVSVEK